MSKVFVSYAREDSYLAQLVVQDLNDLGHQFWYDQRLSGGQQWWDQILASIQGCDVLVACVSPASLHAEACRSEIEYALALGRHVLPLVVAPITLAALPSYLASRQLVPYTGRDRRDAALDLHRSLMQFGPTPPLPSTLPFPPAVPGSYLLPFSDLVNSLAELTPQQQRWLVGELGAATQQGGEPARMAVELLGRLRQRPELMVATVEAVDRLLVQTNAAPSEFSAARVGPGVGPPTGHTGAGPGWAPGGQTPGGPGPGGPFPPGAPPAPRKTSNARTWVILGLITFFLLLVGGCAVLVNLAEQSSEPDCFVNEFGQFVCQ